MCWRCCASWWVEFLAPSCQQWPSSLSALHDHGWVQSSCSVLHQFLLPFSSSRHRVVKAILAICRAVVPVGSYSCERAISDCGGRAFQRVASGDLASGRSERYRAHCSGIVRLRESSAYGVQEHLLRESQPGLKQSVFGCVWKYILPYQY